MLSVIVPVKVCLGGAADSAATARRLKARLPRTPVLVMRRIVMRRIAPLVVIPSPLASRAKVPGPRRERAPYREKAINKVALFAPAYSGGGRGISPKRAPTVCLAGRLEALHFPDGVFLLARSHEVRGRRARIHNPHALPGFVGQSGGLRRGARHGDGHVHARVLLVGAHEVVPH